jgi:ABC-type lipopolysaccharide export system ATPase subunit
MEFTHFVIDNSDGTIFGVARVNGKGRVANFLINGSVKQQSGDTWLELDTWTADIIRQRAHDAYGRVPTYRTNRLLFS